MQQTNVTAIPSKIHLSQVLKTKIDIDNVVELSKLGHITQQNKLVSFPSFVPMPCKGCKWRTSACHDFNGPDTCRHLVDWFNDLPSKQV